MGFPSPTDGVRMHPAAVDPQTWASSAYGAYSIMAEQSLDVIGTSDVPSLSQRVVGASPIALTVSNVVPGKMLVL